MMQSPVDIAPFRALKEMLSRIPGLRILFGVVAVLAILSIARVWHLDRGWTIAAGVVVILFAVVLLVLSKFSGSSSSTFKGPAQTLMWFCVILFMIWAILLTTCVFAKWPVSVSQLPLSPVLQDNQMDPPPPYNSSAFAVVQLSTTIDLTNWRPVSPEQMQERLKVSASREHTIWRLRKTQVAATTFRVVVYTPGLEPELVPDLKHRLVWRGKVDYQVRPGTDRFDKYEYYFDVSNEPVGHVFTIDYEMTRWNTHQGKPHWWHGKVIEYPTESLEFTFVFPKSRPSLTDTLILKDYDAVRETPLTPGADYIVQRSQDSLTVTFTVPNPKYHFGYIYYYEWQDKP